MPEYPQMTVKRAARSSEAAALGAALGELSRVLQSDVEKVVRPSTDSRGTILRQDHLAEAAKRASRVASKIASLSRPLGALSRDTNRDLARLFVASDSFVAAMKQVIDEADKLPQTLEKFFLPLGPTIKEVELSGEAIVSLVKRLEKRLH